MTTDRHQSPPTVDSPSLASGVGRVATLLLVSTLVLASLTLEFDSCSRTRLYPFLASRVFARSVETSQIARLYSCHHRENSAQEEASS